MLFCLVFSTDPGTWYNYKNGLLYCRGPYIAWGGISFVKHHLRWRAAHYLWVVCHPALCTSLDLSDSWLSLQALPLPQQSTESINKMGYSPLKSIHPLWKILKKNTTEGVWIFECTYLLCNFRLGLSQRVYIFYLEMPNEFIYLEFLLPLCRMFLKSSTWGVCNSNGVAPCLVTAKSYWGINWVTWVDTNYCQETNKNLIISPWLLPWNTATHKILFAKQRFLLYRLVPVSTDGQVP